MERNFIKLLQPKNINKPKKRLGPNEDGGYVMSEFVLNECDYLFTYGVGYDFRYEEDFIRTHNKKCYMFDHTIDKDWIESKFFLDEFQSGQLVYISEGLGNDEKCKDFIQHYKELNINGKVLLKIDIEGGEYTYFKDVNIRELSENSIGLMVEVHWIDDENNREKLIEILNRINEEFVLVHIHGNSWGGTWEFEGHNIPKVLELSYVNKKYVNEVEIDTQEYPIEGLDVSNNPNVEDLDLSFLRTV